MTARAALFDLDGTLADTGRDLVAALNVMRAERGLPALPFEQLKYEVGYGSRRLMSGYLLEEGEDLEARRADFLVAYDELKHQHSDLFAGMQEVLDHLEAADLPWAIVTNKPTKQTEDLLAKLKLRPPPRCVVCSDTLPRYKPHPDGIMHVCAALDLQPADGLFIGDNNLDERAAAAAGMPFVAAGWGYWEQGQSDARVLQRPEDLIPLLGG